MFSDAAQLVSRVDDCPGHPGHAVPGGNRRVHGAAGGQSARSRPTRGVRRRGAAARRGGHDPGHQRHPGHGAAPRRALLPVESRRTPAHHLQLSLPPGRRRLWPGPAPVLGAAGPGAGAHPAAATARLAHARWLRLLVRPRQPLQRAAPDHPDGPQRQPRVDRSAGIRRCGGPRHAHAGRGAYRRRPHLRHHAGRQSRPLAARLRRPCLWPRRRRPA
ncbi:hypothetical protein D3C86_1366470 [compost metagenome]